MMNMVKRVLCFNVCVIIMLGYIGCATSNSDFSASNASSESMRPGYGVVYDPDLQPDAEFEAVKQDLAKLLNDKVYTVHDDHIDMSINNKSDTLSFYQLPGYAIVVKRYKDQGGLYVVDLPEMGFGFWKSRSAQRVADNLFFIQQHLQRQQDELFSRLEAKAAEYRTLPVKPSMSEEQRRLIVQANAANQQKEYGRAIALYLQALELEPVSYPAGYFNVALLYAQLHNFNTSISYMKQYLLLVPDAPDARSAQDKIYEWQFMVQK